MNKISLFIAFSFAIQFQSIGQNLDSLIRQDLHSVTSQLKYMLETDQLFRHYMQYGEYGFQNRKWINSDNKKLLDNNKKKVKLDSKIYSHAGHVTHEIDSLNTVNLIRLTKKYGFPSALRLNELNHTSTVGIAIIFVHSPPYFFEQVGELIKKEFKENRLSEGDYRHILWHLRGRKDNIIELMTIPIEELNKI
jgi:hypothetical protein